MVNYFSEVFWHLPFLKKMKPWLPGWSPWCDSSFRATLSLFFEAVCLCWYHTQLLASLPCQLDGVLCSLLQDELTWPLCRSGLWGRSSSLAWPTGRFFPTVFPSSLWYTCRWHVVDLVSVLGLPACFYSLTASIFIIWTAPLGVKTGHIFQIVSLGDNFKIFCFLPCPLPRTSLFTLLWCWQCREVLFLLERRRGSGHKSFFDMLCPPNSLGVRTVFEDGILGWP